MVHTRHLFRVAAALLALTACRGPQSALVTAGRDAERIDGLFTVMTVGALLIWIAVVAVAVYTTVVLGALIAYGMPLLPTLLAIPEDGRSIHVTAKQWWWRVEYQTPAGPVETANELRLALGERVTLQLASPDVIHSFWVPSLAGKMDMIPGRATRLALEPTRTGTFRGTCAEYCGASHALMAFSVIVMPPEEFRTWLEAQRRAAETPSDAETIRGQTVFVASGCTACHTIRGTPAAGRIGPDLTHVGGRERLAAETLPNNPAALAHWISNTDRIKPGAHMPAFGALGSDELSAVAAYLSSLK
jgi:cytochrome c oxidase subunit 2